jgi:hypothetical protein
VTAISVADHVGLAATQQGRASFQRNEHGPRWYQASADPRLGPALRMHDAAARPWTVPELAAISGLSRVVERPKAPP